MLTAYYQNQKATNKNIIGYAKSVSAFNGNAFLYMLTFT